MGNESPPRNDSFEIFAAFLLGLAAVLTAWASFQSGEWGGESVKAYAEGGKLTTKAGHRFQTTFVTLVRDANIDVQAKTAVQDALVRAISIAPDGGLPDLSDTGDLLVAGKIGTARYLYTQHLSAAAYKRFELPLEFRSSDDSVWMDLPADDLLRVYDRELDDDYFEEELRPAQRLFEEAEARFAEGGAHDDISDQFDLVVVLLTVAMFFAGIAQSFKSAMRWPILIAGAAACGAAFVLLLELPSAPSGDDEGEGSSAGVATEPARR